MDLLKADPKRMASLIFNGRLELGEIPARRRSAVADWIETLKQEAKAKAEAEAAAIKKKPTAEKAPAKVKGKKDAKK